MTTVTGQLVAPAGVLPRVTFARVAVTVDPAADVIVLPFVSEAPVLADGSLSIDVPAGSYVVNITVGAKVLSAWATIGAEPVDLADVLQFGPQPEPPEAYATIAALAELAETVADELDEYLPVNGGEVVDSTLSIRKGDGSSGIRFRSTGGAVDIDKLNGDIIIGSWSEPGYTGTQTGLQRWRANGTTFAGYTEFGGNVYGGQQAIDGADGVAKLGAKNGLTNVKIAGLKATPGAPTTGDWAAGEIVLDSAGAWHLCTVAGAPGTWT
jgi:hypothetical protein